MTTISLRISEELNESLEKAAHDQERSKTFLVKKAIESYLEDLYDYNLAQEGYARYVASGKKGHSINEVAERLGIDLKKL